MVGLWPAGRIVSVRANIDGQDAFTPCGYVSGCVGATRPPPLCEPRLFCSSLASDNALTDEETHALRVRLPLRTRTASTSWSRPGIAAGTSPGVPANESGVLSVGATQLASDGTSALQRHLDRASCPGCTLDGAESENGCGHTVSRDELLGCTRRRRAFSAPLLASRLGPDAAQRLLTDYAAVTSAGPHARRYGNIQRSRTRSVDSRRIYDAASERSVWCTTFDDPTTTTDQSVAAAAPSSPKGGRPATKKQSSARIDSARSEPSTRRRLEDSGVREGCQRQATQVAARAARVRLSVCAGSWAFLQATFTDPSGRDLESRTLTVRARR